MGSRENSNSSKKYQVWMKKKNLGWNYILEPLKSTWNGCCWDEKAAETFGGSWVAIATGVPVCPSFPVTTFTWEKYFGKKKEGRIIFFLKVFFLLCCLLLFFIGCPARQQCRRPLTEEELTARQPAAWLGTSSASLQRAEPAFTIYSSFPPLQTFRKSSLHKSVV